MQHSLRRSLHILPTMQPRYYTISSSSSVHPDRVHITVSVTDFKLPSGRRFRGLTSSYLQGLQGGRDSCRVFVRASTFKLPKNMKTPITMIGPGTGIAPMRALLQEREAAAAKSKKISGLRTLFTLAAKGPTRTTYTRTSSLPTRITVCWMHYMWHSVDYRKTRFMCSTCWQEMPTLGLCVKN